MTPPPESTRSAGEVGAGNGYTGSKDEINQKVYEGTRGEATGVVMTGIPGFQEGLCKYCKYNKEEAQKLFAGLGVSAAHRNHHVAATAKLAA